MDKEPAGQLEWGYGTLLGDRDINEHDFARMKWYIKNGKLGS